MVKGNYSSEQLQQGIFSEGKGIFGECRGIKKAPMGAF